jgi:creatinine amidohydrolase
MEFAGTLTLSTETFVRAITEIGLCLVKHGFRHILILNGHGHNLDPIKLVARNIRDATSGEVIVAAANYTHFALDDIKRIRESSVGGIAHACELETSCMLLVDPDGVRMDLAEKYMPVWKGPYFAMDVNVPRNVYVAHHVADFSPRGVFGDPTIASREKGERFLEAIATRVADFIVDFSHWTFASMCEG